MPADLIPADALPVFNGAMAVPKPVAFGLPLHFFFVDGELVWTKELGAALVKTLAAPSNAPFSSEAPAVPGLTVTVTVFWFVTVTVDWGAHEPEKPADWGEVWSRSPLEGETLPYGWGLPVPAGEESSADFPEVTK